MKQILKMFLFSSIAVVTLSIRAETVQPDGRIAEIQSIKPELVKARVSFKVLKSGETLAAAEIPDAEDSEKSSDVEFYYTAKGSSKWTFLDRLQLEGSSFDFRDDGVIKIFIEEGGSSSSSTTSLWRLEKDRLKVIGQDSEVLVRSALNSKTDPIRTTLSTNFLTGRMVVKSDFAHAKSKKIECKFDKKDFETQKISDINFSGAKIPECPDTKILNLETRKLNGQWKLDEVACVGKDLNASGLAFNQQLKKDQFSAHLTLDNGQATYKVKLYNSQDTAWDCSVTRSEVWHVNDKNLTVRNSVESYSGPGSEKNKCAGQRTIPEVRQHRITVGQRMEVELTGYIPNSMTQNCESSAEKLIYSRIK